MQFRLRTLLIVLAVGPMVLYGAYLVAERYAYTVICAHSSSDMRLVAEQLEAEGYVPPNSKPFAANMPISPKPTTEARPPLR